MVTLEGELKKGWTNQLASCSMSDGRQKKADCRQRENRCGLLAKLIAEGLRQSRFIRHTKQYEKGVFVNNIGVLR